MAKVLLSDSRQTRCLCGVKINVRTQMCGKCRKERGIRDPGDIEMYLGKMIQEWLSKPWREA